MSHLFSFLCSLPVDSKTIDHNAKIDEKTMQGLKDLGLFGQQIPLEYGKDGWKMCVRKLVQIILHG